MRVGIYERLMEAEEVIAQALYTRGVSDQAILKAMGIAERRPSDAARRENLYLSSLAAYVEALGGRLEVRAVFGDESVVAPMPDEPRPEDRPG